MLTIWGRANSINVQKVLWCCGELDLPFRRIDAGQGFGHNTTPEYRRLNPNGLVPTIDDDGFVLWESNVIVRYLAAKHMAHELYPADLRQRFEIERWMDWHATTLWPALRPVFVGLVRTPPGERDVVMLDKARRDAESAFAILDQQLSAQALVAGPTFTIGDIPIGIATHRWLELPLDRRPLTSLEAWYRRLRARRAFDEHVAQPLS